MYYLNLLSTLFPLLLIIYMFLIERFLKEKSFYHFSAISIMSSLCSFLYAIKFSFEPSFVSLFCVLVWSWISFSNSSFMVKITYLKSLIKNYKKINHSSL